MKLPYFIHHHQRQGEQVTVRRHAKAPSAGSISSIGNSRAPFGRTFACLLVLAAFAGSGASAASAAVTAKGVNGYFGATGEAGGQLNTPRGTAVNQTSGNVYVADAENNRIQRFSSAGQFLSAWGRDVALGATV